MKPIVVVDGLSVHFGGVKALDDATFEVQRGQTLAIVGANGAGKSTLLNAINGVVRPSSGTVHLLGTCTDGWAPHRVARSGVHRSFQHTHLLESETVLRNVMVGGHVDCEWLWLSQVAQPWRSARKERQLRAHCEELLRMANLEHLAHATTGELAYGVKKLIDIVRALVGNPPVVLLDEPSSGLGEEDRKTLIELLKRVRENLGTTMLMVEHHMDVVREVGDRVLALGQGRVLIEASVSDVRDLSSLGLSSVEGALPDASPVQSGSER